MAVKVAQVTQTENTAVITFGGGINSHLRTADVALQECTAGENFNLDAGRESLSNRPSFDLIATATNANEIRGFAQLRKQNGAISTLVQAGGTVYEWDGASSFTTVGTVNSFSRLRGPSSHNFLLDEYVIITDLNMVSTVKMWDGTTFGDFTHNLGADFYAKYCKIELERALFCNVKTGTVDTPHVLLASTLSDPQTLSTTDRPASSLSAADPFYLPIPDFRPINGMESGFGLVVMSTDQGALYVLSGQDATDYSLTPFYQGSALAGDEPMANVGNDIVMGRQGIIESLSGTINFGDVETDDLSKPIHHDIDKVSAWTIVYEQVSQRIFCFPNNQSACWVFHKDLAQTNLSPWSKYTTAHAMDMRPTAVMTMLDPGTGLPQVYMGDKDGNIFTMNGGGGQDGGTADITVTRTSGLIRPPFPANTVYNIDGWIGYKKQFAADVVLTFQFGGVSTPDREITVSIPESGDIGVYNDSAYYNADSYYSSGFGQKIFQQNFRVSGISSHFQVKASITGTSDIEIEEIGLNFRSAKA